VTIDRPGVPLVRPSWTVGLAVASVGRHALARATGSRGAPASASGCREALGPNLRMTGSGPAELAPAAMSGLG